MRASLKNGRTPSWINSAAGNANTMTTLLCFGLGYCARHFVRTFGTRFDHTIGTVRTSEKAERINTDHAVQALVFDGTRSSDVADAIANCDAILASAPPTESGDPVLAVFADALARAPKLKSVVYLSTVGVYGNHNGAWIDETTPPTPTTARGRARLVAETAWQYLRADPEKSVAVLRLAGIYGPGRNVLAQVANGTAKRIVKPGQVFSRIHVADIASVIDTAFAQRANGIFNVSDDEPTAPQDVVSFAADLLGRAAPPEIAFTQAIKDLSPMALSFYSECRRVRNDRIKRELGITLRFPTYRDGLGALAAGGNEALGVDF
jgi:nucleoside-diphosphate-sugar epimerase